ncbi:unnamed protein product [Phytophthora fragariaefolia]|uniref:Unnamed protein product n=1 Tax=Phytophthora fragariaefolia TaxID=1490495 RepID=A0A9W6Y3J7_9STRA|nr:unnamed protein product [Phytophthora fragariaefolia]
MGVIACKKDVLSVELARHKELIKNLNSVCYPHAVRLYNSSVDSMTTEALETKAGRVVLSLERKAELRALNKIPEKLYTSTDSADTIGNSAATSENSADTSWNSADAAEELKVTMATCSRARRVHFDNEERENPPLEAIDEGLEEVSEAPNWIRARRRTSGNKVEFEGAQLRTSKGIAEFPAELGEKSTPDANAINQLVVQAKWRQSISIAQDEELGWADIKARPKGEFTQLTHIRAHNTRKVAHELVLSKDGLLYQQDMAGKPEELGEASRVEDARHAGAVHFRDTTTEISRVGSARQQVERNSAMVEAKENSAALRGWSCGASVATCGTSESWSHRKALSHNWSGGASVAPYGTSEAWWRKQNLSHQELRVGDDAGPRQPPKKCPRHRRSPAERLRSSRND